MLKTWVKAHSTVKKTPGSKEFWLFDKIRICQADLYNGKISYYAGPLKLLENARPYSRKEIFDHDYSMRFENGGDDYLERMIREQFFQYMGSEINLENPKTFNEKLNWIKLYDKNPLMTICADKARVNEYVKDRVNITDDKFVERIGIFSDPDEIDFNKFPDRFVLKSNWGSGLQIIVLDKSSLDESAVREELKRWIRQEANHYYTAFEFGYRDIEGKIVAEKFLDYEYKIEFFCFNGEPVYYWIILDDKTANVHANFYTMAGGKLPMCHKYPNFDKEISQPPEFEELRQISRILSAPFPFARVDFYKTKDSYKFCEITFVHWAGLMPFTPPEYDLEFGAHLRLPGKSDNL